MMHPQALRENAKTLAALLGVSEQGAVDLLNISVVITTASDDCCGKKFSNYAARILSATVAQVTENSTSSDIESDVEVVVNAATACTQGRRLYVSLAHDRIVIDHRRIRLSPKPKIHPILLLLGACYAAGAALKMALGDKLPVDVRVPLILRFEDMIAAPVAALDQTTDLGQAHLAGAGAVGNGFILALSTLDVRGELYILDPDQASGGNLQRCVWFSETDIDKNKAERLAFLAQPYFAGLSLKAYPGDLRDFARKQNSSDWLQRLIVAVDSRRMRRNLQKEIPREVFDASTTGIHEVVLHFNRACAGGACLCCVYKYDRAEDAHETHVAEMLGVSLEEIKQTFVSPDAAKKICTRYVKLVPDHLVGTAYDSLFKELCGQELLRDNSDRQVLAPFAFVSALAGTYLAIELLLRTQTPSRLSEFNYWRASPWAEPVARLRAHRPSIPECDYCTQPVFIKARQQLWCNSLSEQKEG